MLCIIRRKHWDAEGGAAEGELPFQKQRVSVGILGVVYVGNRDSDRHLSPGVSDHLGVAIDLVQIRFAAGSAQHLSLV